MARVMRDRMSRAAKSPSALMLTPAISSLRVSVREREREGERGREREREGERGRESERGRKGSR